MTINEISAKLFSFNNYLIFCHTRPDGDTLGCAFALKMVLEKLGKEANIVCASPIPQKFGIFAESSSVLLPENISDVYDAHVAVDCSTANMIADSYLIFQKNPISFNIDHHISNTRYAAYNYIEDTAACCEILYKIIIASGCEIDNEIANRLLLGISTDTGNFMPNNVTENTLSTAAKLVAAGGDLHKIAYKMFKSQPVERATLFAQIISRMRFYEDGKIAIITIMQKDLRDHSATQDMTEGFIDFPLSVDGVEVAVSLLEYRQNQYKVSLRSKGVVNVNEVAASFGGGGHVLASGCMISGFYEDVKDKLIRIIGFQL